MNLNSSFVKGADLTSAYPVGKSTFPVRATTVAFGVFVMMMAASEARSQGYQLAAQDSAIVGNSEPFYSYGPTPPGSNLSGTDSGTSFSGTTDSTGKATSLYANLTESRPGVASSSNLTASLPTGNINIYHSDNSQPGGYSEGETNASLYDTVNFSNPLATASTVTTVQFTFRLTGNSNVDGTYLSPGGSLSANFGIDATYFQLFAFPSGSANLTFAPSGATINSATPNWSGTPESLVDVESFSFTGPTASVPIGIWVDASGSGMVYDYNYSVSLQTTGSTTFTSASGVFLTQAVPEPKGWAVLAAGLAPLLRRRRR